MQIIQLDRSECNYVITDGDHVYTLQRVKAASDCSATLVLNPVDTDKLEEDLFINKKY